MRTQQELNEAIEILDKHPRLKEIITLGIDVTTVLTRNNIKSLTRDEFLALCSMPLDFIIPISVRELFITRAKEFGIRMFFDQKSGLIKVKKIIPV
jgi:hypothetical protein